MFRPLVCALALVCVIAVPSVATAGLIGVNTNLSWFFPDQATLFCDNGDAVVGAAIEFPVGCSGFSPVSVDIADTSLTVFNSAGVGFAVASFNGFRIAPLTAVDFVTATFGGGSLGVTSLQVIDGELWVNLSGQGSGTALINFTTTDTAAAVPEPATLLLLGAGLGVIGLRRWRARA